MKEDGSIWVTGRNEYRQLGFATTDSCDGVDCVKTWTKVTNLKSIIILSAGELHSMALDKDSNLFLTGSNANYRLETNNTDLIDNCVLTDDCSKTWAYLISVR